MKLSFCTLGCPDWDIDRIADQASALDFDGVELRGAAGNHIGPEEPADSRAAIKQRFADAGVEIAAVMGYSNFTGDNPEDQQAAVNAMTQMIGVCGDIGCKTLRIFGGHNAEIARAESIKRVVENVKKLVEPAEARGVQLAVETHDDWCVGENLMAAIDGIGSPTVGVCWDVSNAYFKEDMDKTFAAIKDSIVHVHFKDATKQADGKVKSSLPGQGDVEMEKALRLLHEHGYGGYLSFEWEKKWEPDLADPEVAFPHFQKHAAKLMQSVGVPRG